MDYWREVIDEALACAGVVATDEQREQIAGDIEVSHENYGMAMGHDVASSNLRAARERELKDAQDALERERNKVHCKVCNGTGREVTHGPYHSSDSECWKCRGQGRHDL